MMLHSCMRKCIDITLRNSKAMLISAVSEKLSINILDLCNHWFGVKKFVQKLFKTGYAF